MTTRYEPLDASGICAHCGYRRSGHVGKGMVCLDQGGAKVAQEPSKADLKAAYALIGAARGRKGYKAMKAATTAKERKEWRSMGGKARSAKYLKKPKKKKD